MQAGDLLPTIKKLAASYIQEIGDNDATQNVNLFIYLNNALRKLASIAYVMKISDVLAISTSDFVTFKLDSQEITNLYAPLRIMDASGRETKKRTSFADTSGWWRESSNTKIHVKGLTGDFTLHYIAYPAVISSTDSLIEFPDAGSMALCYFTAALILESLPNAKDIAKHYYLLASMDTSVGTQANIDARGQTSGGYVPSQATNDQLFRRGWE